MKDFLKKYTLVDTFTSGRKEEFATRKEAVDRVRKLEELDKKRGRYCKSRYILYTPTICC